HTDNPARTLISTANSLAISTPNNSGRTQSHITVRAGESIQAALDRLQEGGTIELMPGVYHEALTIDQNGVTLRGRNEAGQRAVLDGQGKFSDAIVASGRGLTLAGFDVRHYSGNGIAVQGAREVTFRDLYIEDTGLYGVYPVECDGVLVERVRVTGVRDAGIYVGQSQHIVVRDNEVYGNVTGIEIENSVDALVTNNIARDNTAGILVFVLPNNPSKVGRHTRVVNNQVITNNRENFADKAAIVASVPAGAGIIVMAADETEITANEIRDNNSFGVAVLGLQTLFPGIDRFDVGPTPESNRIYGNHYANNGGQPHPTLSAAGVPGADLIWDGSGWNNTWNETAVESAPTLLPKPNWPAPARRALWRVLRVAGLG
ncbi:MAG: parallel beta-helix domain-containing protein, partial [Acidobacteriota bacterium]